MTPAPRRLSATAVALALGVALGLVLPVLPFGASSAEAVRADSGVGRERASIEWVSWGSHMASVGNNAVATGGQDGLDVRCAMGGLSGQLQATAPGWAWSASGINQLYASTGTGGANSMPVGLQLRNAGSSASFNVSCTARQDGASVPIQSLVLADAEQFDGSASESIEATAPSGDWRLVDFYRAANCAQDVTLTRPYGSPGLLRMTGSACGDGGPAAVVAAQGDASLSAVRMSGSGLTAIAIGVVLPIDHGDAPASYGRASAHLAAQWSGGVIEQPRWEPRCNGDARRCDSVSSAAGLTRASLTLVGPRLGALVDADVAYPNGSDGTADDATGVDDEDAVFTFRGPTGSSVTAQQVDLRAVAGTEETVAVTCVGPGDVRGWLDFDRDGTFAEDEASSTGSCVSGSATIRFRIPADVQPSTTSSPTFLRVRIAAPGTPLLPTGATLAGEVEDHRVAVATAALTATKTTDQAAATAITPGSRLGYTVTLTNSGRLPLSSPAIQDDLSRVLDGATFVAGSASVAPAGGTITVPGADRILRWTGASALAPGASVTLRYAVVVTDSRRGQALVNTASGSGRAPGSSTSDVIAAAVETASPVAVRASVVKAWIVDGVRYEHGQQPGPLSSSAQLGSSSSGTPTTIAYGEARDGFLRGATTTVRDASTVAAGTACTVVGTTATTGGAVRALPQQGVAVTLSGADTRIELVTTVTCDTRLTLVERTLGDERPAQAWAVAADGPQGTLPGPRGASGASAKVTATAPYLLGSSGGDARWASQGWTCIDGTGVRQTVEASTVSVRLGTAVTCTVEHATARLVLLQHVEGSAAVTAEDFELDADPEPLDGLQREVRAGTETEASASPILVRPGHAYDLSSSSETAHVPLRLEVHDGRRTADGSLEPAGWSTFEGSTVRVDAGQTGIYRFVALSPLPFVLPITGGIGADTYQLGGLGLLVLAIGALVARALRRRLPMTRTTIPNPSASQEGTATMATITKSRAARIAAGAGALALASLVALGGAAPASAAPAPANFDADAPASITIHKHEQTGAPGDEGTGSALDPVAGDPIEGVVFDIRRVTSLDLEDPDVWLGLPSLDADDVTAPGSVHTLGSTAGTDSWRVTTGQLGTVRQDVPTGVYLVEEVSAPASAGVVMHAKPFLVVVPQPVEATSTWNYHVNVFPKNTVSDIVLDVEDIKQQGLGSTLTWDLDIAVPVPSQGNKLRDFEIALDIDERLSFDPTDAAAVRVQVGATALERDTHYTVELVDDVPTIVFNDAGLAALVANPDQRVLVQFDTTVDSFGNGTIQNSAALTVNDATIQAQIASAYFGGIEIQKNDDQGAALQGATFEVRDADGRVVAIDGETEFRSGPDGRVIIAGLRTNVDGSYAYTIREVAPPAGYALGTTTEWDIAVPVGTNPAVELTVVNAQVPAYALPVTGGDGQLMFMLGGAGLVLLAVGFALVRRRKAEQQA
ncbi:SpaH/EbpB family LPXTG-anchored major pilin [Agrococcus terreus]|uniref:Gram-positive cocci surface proteins LPxTG domain-containing protein n=1 Tax=Agrococcus terreus TaxID=574649 RepID=A0ABQ2KQ78_9MICO|nr:SpaH/EbpB family LPXTG-anchored major pilin [Agrococcus terreus]GGN89141.1 hypothetical protein GCM10010968_25490 [Agrococcus terreus]